jgi:hypothetical protein
MRIFDVSVGKLDMVDDLVRMRGELKRLQHGNMNVIKFILLLQFSRAMSSTSSI